MLDGKYFKKLGLEEVYLKVMAGERLSYDEGVRLFYCPDFAAPAALAAHDRFRRHGSKTYYVVNRQINYTNICVNGCIFCAFRRDSQQDKGAFLLTHDEILERIEKALSFATGLDEMHMVGGCHPDIGLEWFETLLSKIHRLYPDLPLKAFTPVEIAHFAKMEGISSREVLQRLKNAGLIMMPGGGAEIFDPKLRAYICPHKADAEQWLAISGEAHELGITTNCTMLFGHLETFEQRVDHLCRLREQQDRTHGFACFIPLPFLKENSRLKLPAERQGNVDALDQLRTIAISRLMLDNIPHIKAYWIMLGVKVAQTALWYGADDLDGTIVEEHIGHMAGAKSSQMLTLDQLENMIVQSGFQPVRRNAVFEPVAHQSSLKNHFENCSGAQKWAPAPK